MGTEGRLSPEQGLRRNLLAVTLTLDVEPLELRVSQRLLLTPPGLWPLWWWP